jgi:D-alanine-D-alanine ligase
MATRTITLLYDEVEDEQQASDADEPVYQQVASALAPRGYEIQTLVAHPDVGELVAALQRDDSDLIFNLCESLAGSDSNANRVAALLELLGKPFTGTGSFGMMLAQDKALAKKLFNFHDVRYPKFSTITGGHVEWADELQFPLFVKPSNTDSSVGIDEHSLVHNVKELMERISYIHVEFKAPALIEEFIEGREIFIGVLGNEPIEALPIIEWDFSKVKKGAQFATAEAKWDKSSEGYRAPERFPSDIPEPIYAQIQAAAVNACKALRVRDYGRVDMRLRHRENAKDGDAWEFFVIEVNPNPYLDQRSEVAMAAAKHGKDFPALLERIIELALARLLRPEP